jgi:ABC-2 type transport system ATP-binding protein
MTVGNHVAPQPRMLDQPQLPLTVDLPEYERPCGGVLNVAIAVLQLVRPPAWSASDPAPTLAQPSGRSRRARGCGDYRLLRLTERATVVRSGRYAQDGITVCPIRPVTSPLTGIHPRSPRLASVNTEPAVEISGLVKQYGRTTAVAGLSLRAMRGQITAVLGPNGAGKTTTVEICEGYRRADSGTVRVLGLDPVRDAKALRPRVGVMLQSGGVPTGARAGDYLRVLARFYANPLDPGLLLDRLGLAESARTPFRRLSGGQQQRLSLAAAIIGRPDLLFLDEPTAGLDPQARHATCDLIAGLRAAGATIILTTHYLEDAERLADHVVIVDHGALVAEGSPAELTGTQGQLRFRASPGLDTGSLLAALPPGTVAKESPAGAYLIELTDGVDPQLLAAVTAWCADQGVLAQSLRIESRTLEDVFLELTGRELRP